MILAIISLVVAGNLAADIYAPSMPEMQKYFQTSSANIQLTISLGILGMCLSPPAVGWLSERYGRRFTLLIMHLLFMATLIFCIFAPHIKAFLAARFIMGFSGGAAVVVGFALVSDIYQGRESTKYFAYISTSLTFAYTFGPILGGVIADYFEWQASFIFSFIFSVVALTQLLFYIPETQAPSHRRTFQDILGDYKDILRHPRFWGYAMIPGLLIGCSILFVVTSSFYFITILGLRPGLYGAYQGIIMISGAFAGFITGLIVAKVGNRVVLKWGMSIALMGGILLICVVAFCESSALLITMSFILISIGLGFIYAPYTSGAMELFPGKNGTTSAALQFVRGIIMVIYTLIGSYLYGGTFFPVAAFIGITTILVYLWFLRLLYKFKLGKLVE